MTPSDLLSSLRAAGLFGDEPVRLEPLTGGVSSDIFLVETPARRFVVKTALARLRVRDAWFADVSRNGVERDYFDYADWIVPGCMPCVLAGDSAAGWFAMEYFGGAFAPWKLYLMRGDAESAHARLAGEVLGRVHCASWGDPVARERFSTLKNFRELRIDPYLLTTAERIPIVRGELHDVADRLAATALALVHGDYSPKNLLVAPDRLVVLDAEVAWFGDPAFDSAFMLNHLYLKALLHAAQPERLLALAPFFWSAYVSALGEHADAELEARTVRLLLCLMLARVHGKSPVEYLTTATQHETVTSFVLAHLPHPPHTLTALTAAWRRHLDQK